MTWLLCCAGAATVFASVYSPPLSPVTEFLNSDATVARDRFSTTEVDRILTETPGQDSTWRRIATRRWEWTPAAKIRNNLKYPSFPRHF